MAFATAAPDVEEIRRIAAQANPVLRNLAITECYSRLAAAVADRTGDGANWCTYATWASRQAGRTIRGEDLVDALRRRLAAGGGLLHPVAALWRAALRRGLFQPDTALGRVTRQLHTPFDAFEAASEAVAAGNRKVFAEIGLEFARYLAECDPALPVDAPEFAAFLDGLRPGEPPDGQRLLRQAFTRYQRPTTEARARVQSVVLANLEIGLHEQTRLQPEIRAALDAPAATREDLGRRLACLLVPRLACRPWASWPVVALLGRLGRGAQRALDDVTRRVITECLMVLALPGRVLLLGRHLDAPFPDALRPVTDPELAALLARFEPVAPAPDDSGATDWSDLGQRMHFIVHLFCAMHETRDLAAPPFTPEQVRRLAEGAIPDGPL